MTFVVGVSLDGLPEDARASVMGYPGAAYINLDDDAEVIGAVDFVVSTNEQTTAAVGVPGITMKKPCPTLGWLSTAIKASGEIQIAHIRKVMRDGA